MTCIDCGSAAGSCTCQNWDEIDRLGKETKACHCVHCTPGGELCPRCHPESRAVAVVGGAVMDLDPAAVQADAPNFFGHDGRECGEHRTVGSHRAWCFDCSEWCYPGIDAACKGCELPSLRAALDEANTDRQRLTNDATNWQRMFSSAVVRAQSVEAEIEVANQNLRTLEKTVANLKSGLRYEQTARERVEAQCRIAGDGRFGKSYIDVRLILRALAGEGSEQLPAKPGGDDGA
jgi:hypothetical protein